MLEATTDSLFGKCPLEVEPNLLEYVAEFNDQAWMLVYRYPTRLAGKVLANKQKILEALQRYRELPKAKGTRTAGGSSWCVGTLIIQQEILGMDIQSNIAFLLLIYWAGNSNPSWLSFWIMSYILWHKGLLDRIREEMAPAFQSGHLNVPLLISSCPLLESVYLETLRLGGGTSPVRTVMSPITIGGKNLQAGNDVLILHRALHFNENVWGDSAAVFD